MIRCLSIGIVVTFACFALATLSPALPAQEKKEDNAGNEVRQSVEKLAPAMVTILFAKKNGKGRAAMSSPGIVVDPDGTIVTPQRIPNRGSREVVFKDGSKLAAKTVAVNPEIGITIVKVDAAKPL